MSAQPGWYDAGAAGYEHWWDGSQWTGHSRAVVPAAQPMLQQYSAPVAEPVPMGWFAVAGTADVRWWDGRGWTPYRLREGKPRADVFAIEPGNTAVVLGIVFLVLGLTQFSAYSALDQPIFALTPFLFLATGVVWLIGGIRVSQVRKLPAPSTAPIFDPSTQPLPGELEGPGAGWYPVSGQVSRWWTGAQWSWYTGQKIGVRPTHAGPRGYLTVMTLGWVLGGLGLVGAVAGFAMIGLLGGWVATAIIIPAVVLALVGALVLVLSHVRRYALILPAHPPPLR